MIKFRKICSVFLVFLLILATCLCDTCYKYNYLSGVYTTYCSGYCSGLYGNEYCNYYYYYYYASSYYVISGGAIAGIVIGVLFMTAIVVKVVYICNRSQARRRTGTIITNPGRNPHVAVSHSTTTVECFGDVCYKYSYYYYNIYFEYCSGYCYGYYGYEYCSRNSSYMSGGSIAGMVIGILFFAAIIVAIVFVCKRSQARRRQGTVLARGQGTILTRGPHANVAVTHTTTTGFAQYPAPSGYPPPPAYGNVNQYPNMAAYPPPPTYSQPGNQGIGPSAPAFGYGNPAQPQYASSFDSLPPPHM